MTKTNQITEEKLKVNLNDASLVPLIFVGVADEMPKGSFPLTPIDIFQLSLFKQHLIYPANIQGTVGIFLVHANLFNLIDKETIAIIFRSANGKEIWTISLSGNLESLEAGSAVHLTGSPPSEKEAVASTTIMNGKQHISTLMHKSGKWALISIPLPGNVVVPEPSVYTIELHWSGQKVTLGEMQYVYRPTLPFTPEEINAIHTNPNAVKALRMILGCRNCPSKLHVYTALERDDDSEREGFIWQAKLGDWFKCECGTTNLPLQYMRESLHALLGRESKFYSGPLNLNRIGLYAHNGIIKIVEEFNRILDKHKDEATFQKFIEEHPVMLSRFHAIKLFKKPNILGKLKADFAVLDADKNLVLIELEKPGIKLFTKKEGQPSSDLIHAYEQVRAWLREYAKHPHAVLEGLGLSGDEVMAVKGAVIAGRNKGQNREHMQRHRADPFYAGIAFLTLDDLSASVRQISLHLA
ncbi:MAG: DUF4263 domain-containing protein [Nitrospirae bacterium]|nr:MAG: DUF4263 domain-containing protein [Nitrospirota bacterium]